MDEKEITWWPCEGFEVAIDRANDAITLDLLQIHLYTKPPVHSRTQLDADTAETIANRLLQAAAALRKQVRPPALN